MSLSHEKSQKYAYRTTSYCDTEALDSMIVIRQRKELQVLHLPCAVVAGLRPFASAVEAADVTCT